MFYGLHNELKENSNMQGTTSTLLTFVVTFKAEDRNAMLQFTTMEYVKKKTVTKNHMGLQIMHDQ